MTPTRTEWPRTLCAQCGDEHRAVDVYPVGVIADVTSAWRYLTARYGRGDATAPPLMAWRLRRAHECLTHVRRTVVRHVRARQWRELRQSFNGYLAEPYHFPGDGSLPGCGHGWTRARAVRSLYRRGWKGHP